MSLKNAIYAAVHGYRKSLKEAHAQRPPVAEMESERKKPAEILGGLVCVVFVVFLLCFAAFAKWSAETVYPAEERNPGLTLRWQDCRRVVRLDERPRPQRWETWLGRARQYTCAGDGACVAIDGFEDSCQATVYPDPARGPLPDGR
jgi:hypothetical protein